MIYAIVIPILLLVAPWLLVRFVFPTDHTRNLVYKTHAWYLLAAAIVWELALFLPNVPISDETDTFTMHSLGGCVAVILFLYTTKVYRITFAHWWQPVVAVYLFVSGLGVLNELFEFFLTKSGIQFVPNGDTWWDLTANTFGSLTFYGLYCLGCWTYGQWHKKTNTGKTIGRY